MTSSIPEGRDSGVDEITNTVRYLCKKNSVEQLNTQTIFFVGNRPNDRTSLKMEAIELNTQVQDGQISIPSRFKSFLNKRVKVIVLEDTLDPYDDLKEALVATNKAAKEAGLDKMTLEEINAEIAAVRNGD